MADYSNLKTAIENAVDWNNGDNEITGQNLLDILETIIDSLGAKYKFADVATPSSSISTPDEPLFYLAGAGTYANFSGLTVNVQRGTLAIFYYDTAWHWTSVRTDSDAFFNVNQYLEAPSTTYTKATGRNAVPEALRSKGMIITYLTTNGWIIEQNLSTSGTWNADANWQTIGPVSVSQNTLTIGGEEKGELAGQLIENPEWVKVVTDNQDKILYGVKTDGKFYFGDGCPPQVVEYVTTQLEELEGDFTTLLNAKVDKVTGKSLIDANVAENTKYIENPEWIDVKTDSEGRILEGINSEGEKEINMPIITPLAEIQYLDNPEYIKALTDGNDRIIECITKEGEKKVLIPLRNKFIEDKINSVDEKTKAVYNPKSYYDNGDNISPLIKNNESKPLIYRANAFFDLPICYPGGTVIYAASNGNQIKRKSPNGTETTLLTITGSLSFRMIWMDSNYNIYVAPQVDGETYYQNSGLYKLNYGEDTFEQVLSLASLYSESSSARASESYTFWTMTEDREGNLYAGAYGNPFCPYLYKSTDGGDTWNLLKDFRTIVPQGRHIHFIIYNKYDNALYCTVGEINMLLKSTDGGNTWIDCNVEFERMKSTSACVVSDGIVFGSDYAYWGMMYKLYADGSYKTTAKIWANAIFAIRQSDLTGYLYAIGVIDSAVNSRDWYPPVEAISDDSVLQNWIESAPSHLSEWQEYYNSMIHVYPSDAIRPQHTAILISKDNGESWEVLLRLSDQTSGTLGTFKNGECSFTMAGASNNTIVISEGKQKFAEGGIDCTGDILIKLNDTNIVEQI